MDETTNIRKILAYNIRKIREEKQLTQQQLAEKSGITPLAICKIETEKVWPKDSSIEKIANVFGIESQDLFINKILEDTLSNQVKIMQTALAELQGVIQKVPTKSLYAEKHTHI